MESLGTTPAMAPKKTMKKHEPNPDNHRMYLNCFDKFERVYGLVKSKFVRPSGFILESAGSKY